MTRNALGFVLAILIASLLWPAVVGETAEKDASYLGVPVAEIETVMQLGYNLDPRTSELIESIIREYPDSPIGLCLKAARLFRLNDYQEGEDEDLKERFEAVSEAAIEAARRYLSDHPSIPEARYAVAMCELNLARYYIENGRWLGGFFKARSGLSSLNALLKDHPDFHDAKLPIGVANCFLDEAPVYLKPIALLLRFSGDMDLGLKQLKDAEEKGFLTRYESLYYQVGVQWELRDDREVASKILDRFLDRFPRNADAALMRAILDRKLERFDDSLAAYDRLLAMPEVAYLGAMREWALFQSGYVSLKLEDGEDALRRANLALKAAGDDGDELRAWANTLKGNALIHLKRFEEAEAILKSVKRSDSVEAYKASRKALTEELPKTRG
ncbi:MAG: hypothetical protein CBD18_07170 [Opitutales bacterium TMED158]|nr:MAG: hypothetical protein CBD18_07170 [Opitutales bacterium TMED158]